MQRVKTKIIILASLLALAPAAVLAQASKEGGSVGANLDAGVSGRTSGLISGGGLASSSLDANVSASPRSKASSTRPGADANASIDADSHTRAKSKKQRASDRTSGFSSFGSRRRD